MQSSSQAWLRANIQEVIAELISIKAVVLGDETPLTEDTELRDLARYLSYARANAQSVLAAHYEKPQARPTSRMQTRRPQ